MEKRDIGKNKAALVTGGAVRLGKAIALALAGHGFDIALHYNSSQAEALKTADEIKDCGVDCELFQLDLSEANQFSEFMAAVCKRFPNLNLLVNSASGYIEAAVSETTLAIFDSQMTVNLRAPFFLTRAFSKLCKKGSVINIIDNKIAFNQYPYSAYLLSKKGLAEFTKMAAIEFAPSIKINGIAPGIIMFSDSNNRDYIDWRIKGIPLRKKGETEYITDMIIYLVENSFITGQIFFVDGGESVNNVGLNIALYKQEKESNVCEQC